MPATSSTATRCQYLSVFRVLPQCPHRRGHRLRRGLGLPTNELRVLLQGREHNPRVVRVGLRSFWVSKTSTHRERRPAVHTARLSIPFDWTTKRDWATTNRAHRGRLGHEAVEVDLRSQSWVTEVEVVPEVPGHHPTLPTRHWILWLPHHRLVPCLSDQIEPVVMTSSNVDACVVTMKFRTMISAAFVGFRKMLPMA